MLDSDLAMLYQRDKGMDKIRSHACDFISKRLAPAEPVNDGKQTPMIHVRDLPRQIMDEGHAIAQMRDSEWRGSLSGHLVFIAQHATGCCCRGCLEKWHRIPKGTELTDEQQKYVVDVLMAWIERLMKTDESNTGREDR
ncbi:MAG: DUF4186 domain-containing protein [Lachnospiraceae bacterium]|nr:DUF4186 domain-containing protein [Lachnospiraceae bacterium]